MDGKATVLCEKNSCLMDQDVIDCVNNHGNSIWVARNYSDFWGRTLEDGLNYKLGTINPSRSVNIIVSISLSFFKYLLRNCYRVNKCFE